ncbi:MAG: phosphatase PAP2 family protein [Spirochaetia bacterium]|nr:phosphatase PAP2 family protein [Spirochaetia bacterium]
MRRIIPSILLIVVLGCLQPLCADQLLPLDMSGVPAFDRACMQPYNRDLEVGGTAFELASLLAPALLIAEPADEYLRFATMYGETLVAAYALKELGKHWFSRARPFLYYQDYPEEKIGEGDAYDSFPSGHATMAFAGAAFTSYVFAAYHPDSVWKIPVTAVSFSLAMATAALRVASGNHFPSDVLAGAVLGTLVGVGIPFLHRSLASKQELTASVTPFGVAFRVALR